MANTNNFFRPIKTHYDTFKVVLCNRDHTALGTIQNVDFSSIHLKGEMTNGNEVQFDVYYELDGEVEPLWDSIVDLKLIYVPELDDYLEITINDYDSVEKKKSVVGVDAGIAELSQTILYNLEINTEKDLTYEEDPEDESSKQPTIFYNPDNPKKSLLNRILYKMPQYSIGHVPVSVAAKDYEFSVTGQSVWDFLTGDVAKNFEVFFTVDNKNKVINAYDLLMVCNTCHKRQKPYYEYGYYERQEFASDSDMKVVTDSDNAWLCSSEQIVSFKRLACKYCGGHDLDYFGEDTHLAIDKNNLTDEIQLTVNTDAIKNTLKLEAGDDLMTSTVMGINPNGSEYISKFNELDYNDMPDTLIEKINQYNAVYDSYKDEYATLMEQYYDGVNKAFKYKHELMPSSLDPDQPITAATEAAKLTVENLSPMGLMTVGEGTSLSTVNGSIAQFAKVFVKTGYVSVEVDMTEIPATFTYEGVDQNNHHYGVWNGRFLVTNYSDKTDTAYSQRISVIVNDDYETYLNQKIAKNIVRYDDKEGSIYNVLGIDTLEAYRFAISKYCVKRLQSFKDALSNCINIICQEGHGNPVKGKDPDTGSDVVDEFYTEIYVPYSEKIIATEAEISRRQTGLEPDGTPAMGTDGYGEPYATANVCYWANMVGLDPDDDNLRVIENPNPGTLEFRKEEIQDALNFKNFIGEDYYKIYCAYRREDTYSNSNYISTNLTTKELFANAKKFMEVAEEELEKSSTPQYTVSCNLYNLLPTNGYEYFRDKFVLGNWIRVIADNQLFRLRLISYSINFDNQTTVNVEFSNVIKIGNIMTDIESILKSAKSMSTSYNATAKKAETGHEADKQIGDFVKNGLLSALTTVKNNNDEEITVDKFGIYAKSYDPDTDTYSPKQLRITHNILVFTTDNWQSASAALGEHDYRFYDERTDSYKTDTAYGLTAQFVQAGHINGTQIIGGDIYSNNYSVNPGSGSHLDLQHGYFSFGGGRLTFDGTKLEVKNGTISGSNISGSTFTSTSGKFLVDENGKMTCQDANIAGSLTSGGTIQGSAIIGGTINVPNTSSPKFIVDNNGYMTCTGATINGAINNGNGKFTVDINGDLTARRGTIGGWTIHDYDLKSTNNNVTFSDNGNIYCDINNERKWGIYSDGSATFSNITATGGRFTNVEIDGYVDMDTLNAKYAVVRELVAQSIEAQEVYADNIEAGTIQVGSAVVADKLDVQGTIKVNQIEDSAGHVPTGTLLWQSIAVAKALTQSDKTYIWQRNSDNKIEYSTSAPAASGWTQVGAVVTNVPTKRIFVLGIDNASSS